MPLSDRYLDRAARRHAGGGQFGFASAVPLLNQVNNLLLARPAMSRGGLPADPRPATVSAGRFAGPAGRIRRATQLPPSAGHLAAG
jgi:membrane carboxypeptidase/penicillin-binding protein PbpC